MANDAANDLPAKHALIAAGPRGKKKNKKKGVFCIEWQPNGPEGFNAHGRYQESALSLRETDEGRQEGLGAESHGNVKAFKGRASDGLVGWLCARAVRCLAQCKHISNQIRETKNARETSAPRGGFQPRVVYLQPKLAKQHALLVLGECMH